MDNYLAGWREAIRIGDFNRACSIELHTYNKLIKPLESLANWNQWQDCTYDTREMLTNWQTRSFPSISIGKTGILAVVLHNFSGLAHEQQFGRSLKKLLAKFSNYRAYVVYAFGEGIDRERVTGIYGVSGTDVIELKAINYVDASLKLERALAAIEAGTVVYPSIAFFSFWMSLLCRHDNQKFMQMKYYPRRVGRISEWGGGDDGAGLEFREVRGEEFKVLPVDLSGLPRFAARRVPDGARLRIGSVSRVEKIQDTDFLQSIVTLLERNQNLEYLITGRPEDEKRVPKLLRDHPRATFVGWVSPIEFISELDIYIDPWPYGGGDMSFMAIVNRVPYVTRLTADGMLAGPLATIQGFVRRFHDVNLLDRFLPDNSRDVIHMVEELASSTELRSKVGESWREAASNICDLAETNWRSFLFD